MTLLPNERLDVVNDSLRLIQKTDGLTFGTDALLLAAYIDRHFASATELGSGSGIISMLLLARNKAERITALEVQEDYARLTMRNAALNGLDSRLEAIHADLRDYRAQECELVFSNPPYMRADCGRSNKSEAKRIARHEVCGTIGDFCRAASRLLKFGGTFAVVYRTDRLAELICSMRECRIEPKRMTTVHANISSPPSMVLIEGRRGGNAELFVTSPLIIYADKDNTTYTDDMNYIMNTGSFPDKYRRTNK